jgi:hypothetical protein
MTVGDLRELLMDLPDDTPFLVHDTGFEGYFSGSVSVRMMQYHRISENFTDSVEPDAVIPSTSVRCLVVS